MLIDFHTHFFPDNIAKETITKLTEIAKVQCFGDGTLNSLISFMQQDNVTFSVNQPIATKPDQVKSINRKMVEINKKTLPVICFGSMHPDYENIEEEILFLKNNGVKGLKLHPEYQNFFPDDDKMLKIYDLCVKNNLIILFHAGVDNVVPTIHGTPKRFQQLLSIKGLKFVLAHMGGYQFWDDVEKYLVGKNVYFDLGYVHEMDNEQLKRMILSHGAEKILFGTDFPWKRVIDIKQKVLELNLGDDINQKIFYKTAATLLKLDLRI